MSQDKVDRYKKEKANRKKTLRRQKIWNYVRTGIVGVIAIALVGWIGFSAYNTYDSNRESETIEIDYTAVDELAENITAVDQEEAE